MAANKPGDGFLGWLGRQLGHVKKAVKTDVEKTKIVHRETKVQEAPLPDTPGVTLRRTVIDEVIVEKDVKPQTNTDKHG
jgi:hypothetical protein